MRRKALVAVLVALLVGASPTAAATQQLRYGVTYWNFTPFTTPNGNAACRIDLTMWGQELGLSGVNRLRAKFYLHSATDALNSPAFAYQSTGWAVSAAFPNDAQSYWLNFRAAFNVFAGGLYKIRVKLVGERPSIWQPDLVLRGDVLVDVGCGIDGGM